MNHRTTTVRRGVLAASLTLGLLAAACSSDDDTASPAPAEQRHDQAEQAHDQADVTEQAAALHAAMQDLWADHMQWTFATVDAFFHNADAVEPNLNRLLANQGDIGAAIVPFYGQEAGDQLTELLTAHINQAVPVLQAAQAGDDAALQAALDSWYANAQEIADFLSGANPDNWPQSATRPALEMHIDQTTAYAVDLLQGDYAKAIGDYDAAFDHMMELADILADGITAQFPDQLAG